MKQAGDFAILGSEETCTGDPARRAGNEHLYMMLAEQNVATLNNYKPKKIVTTCPHCFNTLLNEYPDLGAKYEVVHHSTTSRSCSPRGKLAHPRREGQGGLPRLVLPRALQRRVRAPRDVLARIPGVELVEAE
jgi:Fe-S oxidoreductase